MVFRTFMGDLKLDLSKSFWFTWHSRNIAILPPKSSLFLKMQQLLGGEEEMFNKDILYNLYIIYNIESMTLTISKFHALQSSSIH